MTINITQTVTEVKTFATPAAALAFGHKATVSPWCPYKAKLTAVANGNAKQRYAIELLEGPAFVGYIKKGSR